MGAAGKTINLRTEVKFRVEECCNCGVQFAMTMSTYNHYQMHSSGSKRHTLSFFCPNGHQQHYQGKTEAQQLREQVEQERERTRFAQRRLKSEQGSHRATKGHLTRAKTRSAAGTCLHCNRTFKQLARHMKSKHPEKCRHEED